MGLGFGVRGLGSGAEILGREVWLVLLGSSLAVGYLTWSARHLQESDVANRTGNYFPEMCSSSEAGSYLRLIDFCITQL